MTSIAELLNRRRRLLGAEAPLFYQYQSGAINESYADVFGELIDLAYKSGTDTSGVKWKIGEDSPIGAFRDMRTPTRFGHPDRVRSPKWHTGAADDGGVHRNSDRAPTMLQRQFCSAVFINCARSRRPRTIAL